MTLKRKIQLKWKGLLNLIGFFALVAVVFASYHRKSDEQVRAIVVTVDDYQDKSLLSPVDVKNIILENFENTLLNREIKKLDLNLIEAILSEEEMVNQTEVYVDHKNQLHVEVWTKKPMFRVFTHEQSVYVDDLGNVFPTSPNHTVRVPIVSGHLDWITDDESDDKQSLIALMDAMSKDDFLTALVDQVHIHASGEYELVPKVGYAKIRFGEPTEVEEKFEKLKRFYAETVKRTGLQAYKTIDVGYHGQVVCKLASDKT